MFNSCTRSPLLHVWLLVITGWLCLVGGLSAEVLWLKIGLLSAARVLPSLPLVAPFDWIG